MPFTALQVPPPPFTDPWVDADGYLDSNVMNWFLITLLPALALSPSVSNAGSPPLVLSAQTDAVPTTPIPVGTLSTGLYRVSVWMRITDPDGVSSSVTPQVTYPSSGTVSGAPLTTCTETAKSALTSDAVDEPFSYTFLVQVDAPGPISFSTLYMSNTPNAAEYEVELTVERVQ